MLLKIGFKFEKGFIFINYLIIFNFLEKCFQQLLKILLCKIILEIFLLLTNNLVFKALHSLKTELFNLYPYHLGLVSLPFIKILLYLKQNIYFVSVLNSGNRLKLVLYKTDIAKDLTVLI